MWQLPPPSIGVAPAVVNAIYNATGIEMRDLPATPDRVLDALTRGGRRGTGR